MTGRLPYAEDEDEVPGLTGAAPPIEHAPTMVFERGRYGKKPSSAAAASPPGQSRSGQPGPRSAAPVAEVQRRQILEAVTGRAAPDSETAVMGRVNSLIAVLRLIDFTAIHTAQAKGAVLALSAEAAAALRAFQQSKE